MRGIGWILKTGTPVRIWLQFSFLNQLKLVLIVNLTDRLANYLLLLIFIKIEERETKSDGSKMVKLKPF